MKPDAVVSVDCSTSASKAIVWDRHGHQLSEGRATFSLLNPHPGWWEQRADDWWEATSSALRQAMAGIEPSRVAAICMTHQRETFVPVDEAGKPLRNGTLWLDERAFSELEDIDSAVGSAAYHQISGKPLSTTPSLPNILWLAKNEPDIFAQAHMYLDVHAFLVHRMCGRFKTSWGCADPMGVFDLKSMCWSQELLDSLGLRLEQFPSAYAPGEIMDRVNDEAAAACGLPAGLPIVAALGDGQSAGLGANITTPGQAYLNLGTAVVSGAFSDKYTADPAFRTLVGGVPGSYLMETVLRGGTFTISWFLDKFSGLEEGEVPEGQSREEYFEALAREVPAGSLGLMLVPYWNGVMNPYWDPAASGIIVGWRGSHDRSHLYRAILEGIAFEQRLATDGVEEAIETPIERFVAMGGGSRSPLWCQIVADITGKEVIRSASPEATCLGAGILAATAAGFYGSVPEAAAAMVKLGESYTPVHGTKTTYDRLYEDVYCHLFPALRAHMGKLADLSLGSH